MSYEQQIGSIEGTLKYYFLDKQSRPFIGLGGGYFEESLKMDTKIQGPYFNESYRDVFSIYPAVGYLFDSKITEGLYINTELSYHSLFKEVTLEHFIFNVGLYYSFNFNN